MHSINNLKGEQTIIVIAHRLSTIKNFDKIKQLEDGKIKKIIVNKEI